MDIRKLQKIAVSALDDIKAEDIEVINTSKLTSLFDRIIVASGNSNRQVKALARNVHNQVKEAGGHVYGMEGEENGEWVLVDLGDIVVHVMQPAVRAHYNLEELWAVKPAKEKTKGKVGDGDTPKARSSAKRGAPTAPKTPAKRVVSEGTPAKRVASGGAPAKRAASGGTPAKSAAKREAPAKRALSKEKPAKRAASRDEPATRTTAAKSVRRRTPPKGEGS